MSRPHIIYAEKREGTVSTGPSAEQPTAGLFKIKMVRDGVFAAVRLWYGPPLDPWDGTELDRSWRWMATVNGEVVDYLRVWPKCEANPISQAEYDHIVKVAEWAKTHAPNSPQANPRRKVDPLTAPLPF